MAVIKEDPLNSNPKLDPRSDRADRGRELTERRSRARRDQPGRIGFDDLGNAQYQWTDERMLEESEDGDTRRQRALSVANLVLMDDDPPPGKAVVTNTHGLRVGYNPYDSGQLTRASARKPRDLRALSKWIEAQKRAAANQEDSD